MQEWFPAAGADRPSTPSAPGSPAPARNGPNPARSGSGGFLDLRTLANALSGSRTRSSRPARASASATASRNSSTAVISCPHRLLPRRRRGHHGPLSGTRRRVRAWGLALAAARAYSPASLAKAYLREAGSSGSSPPVGLPLKCSATDGRLLRRPRRAASAESGPGRLPRLRLHVRDHLRADGDRRFHTGRRSTWSRTTRPRRSVAKGTIARRPLRSQQCGDSSPCSPWSYPTGIAPGPRPVRTRRPVQDRRQPSRQQEPSGTRSPTLSPPPSNEAATEDPPRAPPRPRRAADGFAGLRIRGSRLITRTEDLYRGWSRNAAAMSRGRRRLPSHRRRAQGRSQLRHLWNPRRTQPPGTESGHRPARSTGSTAT